MKILVGITCCHQARYPEALSRNEPEGNSACVQASRETWIKTATDAGVDVRFFYGEGATREPLPDEVFLNVGDDYDHLIEKVRGMCQWAHEQGYDFMMKADADSFINIKNFLASEFREWDYTGRGWGLGYVLSKKAMERVAAETQRRSWAEDAHAMRTLFAWGNASPDNKIKLYGDGRYVFAVNLTPLDVDLLDTAFIVCNPMTAATMHTLHKTGRLSSIVPMQFTSNDLWTAGVDRPEHASVFNAYFIRGEECPHTYDQWIQLSQYDRQPYKDWRDLVMACLETEQLADCPSFEQWMQPIEGRKAIQEWAKSVNTAIADKLKQQSERLKDGMEGK
jgi:hypothetical protein